MFEGLARAFKPEGAFADDLRAAGFDPSDPQQRYSSRVLEAVLDVIHRHCYPVLSREEAQREIGRVVVSKFFETIVGRVIGTLFKALGVERFLLRLPKIAHLGSSGLDIQAERVAPGEVRLVFRGQQLTPDFIAGTLDGAVEVARKQCRVEVTRRGGPSEFELRVTGLR